LPAIAGLTLISNVYFSLGSSIGLVKVFVFNWICNLVLNIALFSSLGHNGIALATSLSTAATFILAVKDLKSRLPSLDLWSLLGGLVRMGLATAGMIGAILVSDALLRAGLNDIMPFSTRETLLTLLFGALVGGIAYAVGALALRLGEMRAFVRAVLRQVPFRT
jgi:putative peptidoglycan lipid II flippase